MLLVDCPKCSFPLNAGKNGVFCYCCDFWIPYNQEKHILRDISETEIEDLILGFEIDGLLSLDLDAPDYLVSKIIHLDQLPSHAE